MAFSTRPAHREPYSSSSRSASSGNRLGFSASQRSPPLIRGRAFSAQAAATSPQAGLQYPSTAWAKASRAVETVGFRGREAVYRGSAKA